jgi:prephenate dehydrogenase
MSVNVACIGLSQISVSAALTLTNRSKDFKFKGWDPSLDARVNADRTKVFGAITKKPQEAIRDADLVLLSLPSDEAESTFKILDVTMGRDVMVINISPMQVQTLHYFREVFGKKVPFISVFPVLQPDTLEDCLFGPRAAREDMFDKSLIFISDAQDAPPAVLDLAVDFAVLLGGQPLFTTPEELDGLIAANLLLPQLSAVALMKAASKQPSWHEGEKLAGGLLFHSTLPLADLYENEYFGFTARANGENMTRLVEDLIRELIEVRDLLKEENKEKISDLFNQALDSRDEWLTERYRSQMSPHIATSIPGRDEALKRFLKLGK